MVNNIWLERNENQVRHATDASMYGESLALANTGMQAFPGWVFWKKYPNGREYLVHAYDRSGKGTTLGARATESERQFVLFKSQQAEAKLRLSLALSRVKAQARFVRAARLNRFPRAATQVAGAFSAPAMNNAFLVVGTHALYAYEALADVLFLPQVMATQDLDVLWDAKRRLQTLVVAESINEQGALGILKGIDKTYTTNTEKTFQAINRAGFVVDFLCTDTMPEQALITPNDGINPIALPGLDWLLMQRCNVMLFDQDGLPLTLTVPVPRLFAAHKMWLSLRDDRKPGKRDRDRKQAEAVAALVAERKPVLEPLNRDALKKHNEIFAHFVRMFPPQKK